VRQQRIHERGAHVQAATARDQHPLDDAADLGIAEHDRGQLAAPVACAEDLRGANMCLVTAPRRPPAMTTRAAVYARISKDDGEALGVARQVEDCTALAAQRGWQVVGTYTDNNVSATHAKVRPQYQRMIADIEAGAVD